MKVQDLEQHLMELSKELDTSRQQIKLVLAHSNQVHLNYALFLKVLSNFSLLLLRSRSEECNILNTQLANQKNAQDEKLKSCLKELESTKHLLRQSQTELSILREKRQKEQHEAAEKARLESVSQGMGTI